MWNIVLTAGLIVVYFSGQGDDPSMRNAIDANVSAIGVNAEANKLQQAVLEQHSVILEQLVGVANK